MAKAKYQKGDVLKHVESGRTIEVISGKHIGHTTALAIMETKADGTKESSMTNAHKLTKIIARDGGPDKWSHQRQPSAPATIPMQPACNEDLEEFVPAVKS